MLQELQDAPCMLWSTASCGPIIGWSGGLHRAALDGLTPSVSPGPGLPCERSWWGAWLSGRRFSVCRWQYLESSRGGCSDHVCLRKVVISRPTPHLAFSALSSAMSPPASLCLASSSSLFWIKALISLTFSNATFVQCSKASGLTVAPPYFAIWHNSPCLFMVRMTSPCLTCSSAKFASTKNISSSKYEKVTQSGWCKMDNGIGSRSRTLRIVAFSPSTTTSGLRKCCNAAMTAMHDASISPPSWSMICTSARRAKHFEPAMMQSDSVSSALERRMAFSSMRERMTSASVGLAPS